MPGAPSGCIRASDAIRWKVPAEVLSNALERSAEKAFAGRSPSDAELDRYFDALHLADLALACACAIGRDEAWDYFVREFRPGMYRAADAIDASGGAREIAETLYAELFGLKELDGKRQSVFRYFHGRSSLATWLRSLIAQRHVDRHRETRRLEPLPEDSSAGIDPESVEGRASRSRPFRRGDARRAVRRHRRAGTARSPSPRLLLCAGDDARADWQAHRRARSHGVASAGAHAAIDSRRGRAAPEDRASISRPPRSTSASKASSMTPASSTRRLAGRRRGAQEIRRRSF